MTRILYEILQPSKSQLHNGSNHIVVARWVSKLANTYILGSFINYLSIRTP